MTDRVDPLAGARAALDAGRADEALQRAWQATMPAVLRQDDESLSRAVQFAEVIAAETSGATRRQALENAAYWAACVDSPRADQGSAWSVKRWFERTPKE